MLKNILNVNGVKNLSNQQKKKINGGEEANCRACPVNFFCCGYGCFDPASVLYDPC
ncbi:hypothetical protein [Aquimarina macrocephali]|uniref:hypothetical protein n=1 Tax=Aquimarina macrocephali TaxID=666563 RepID=UPI0004BC03C4|nr:hypothetical protein [Aquimarina macrocephali]